MFTVNASQVFKCISPKFSCRTWTPCPVRDWDYIVPCRTHRFTRSHLDYSLVLVLVIDPPLHTFARWKKIHFLSYLQICSSSFSLSNLLLNIFLSWARYILLIFSLDKFTFGLGCHLVDFEQKYINSLLF